MTPSSLIPDITWQEVEGELRPFVDGELATWAPQAGSQTAFMFCPIFETTYTGTRGPGKTDALLMDFAQHCGQGYGAAWSGILFRRSFPELADVIAKSEKWFKLIFPRAEYNRAQSTWKWPGGEKLKFSFFERESDYWKYHGHSYPWIGWEELTTWPDPKCYLKMLSCSRSSRADMPRKYRSTTNPYGPGHNWVKKRFRLPVPEGAIVGPVIRDSRTPDGAMEPERVAIHGTLWENKVFLHAEPDYADKIRAAASNSAELAAWLRGDWNIVAGGMMDDLWSAAIHVVPNVPLHEIPRGWKIDRSYDHGQSKPFSVGWWAESNGEPWEVNGRTLGSVSGDLIRVAEWYGWTGNENEGVRMMSKDIARGILEREEDWGLKGRVHDGIADASIFDRYEADKSVAGDMEAVGLRWNPSDKGPGSRKQGWERIRAYLKGAIPEAGIREEPGLFACERCHEGYIRTIPGLPRSERDLDDVDSDAEDHAADEVRYRVRAKYREIKRGQWK